MLLNSKSFEDDMRKGVSVLIVGGTYEGEKAIFSGWPKVGRRMGYVILEKSKKAVRISINSFRLIVDLDDSNDDYDVDNDESNDDYDDGKPKKTEEMKGNEISALREDIKELRHEVDSLKQDVLDMTAILANVRM